MHLNNIQWNLLFQKKQDHDEHMGCTPQYAVCCRLCFSSCVTFLAHQKSHTAFGNKPWSVPAGLLSISWSTEVSTVSGKPLKMLLSHPPEKYSSESQRAQSGQSGSEEEGLAHGELPLWARPSIQTPVF
eukprot:535799-Pelagomonas_calceolata.AAC.2